MNYEQILNTLKESDITIDDFAFNHYPDDIENKLGNIKEVDQYGGEGQGDNWYSVKHFEDHDVYIKLSAYYSSYEGIDFWGDWDDMCTEVKPTQKTITVYESF